MKQLRSTTTTPLISAILCTYNRAPLLGQALGALCAQTLGLENFEVLVIDDGSTDDTRQVVEAFSPILNLHYAYQTNSGLASGKNHGICLARAPIVVFLDDDDVLDSRCLEQHYLTHQEFPGLEYGVLGYTGLAYEPSKSPLMRYVTEIGCHLFSYPSLDDGATLDFSYFWGGRSSCKRLFLLEHGIFNPVFRFGAEDIELGVRLESVGLRVVYNRSAVSHMIRTLSFDDFCRRCRLQGRSNWVFSTLHQDEKIGAWTQIEGAEAEWESIAPRYAQIIKVGQDLDRLASERMRADLPLDKISEQLLYRSYSAAFQASRIKGTVEKMTEDREIERAALSALRSEAPPATPPDASTDRRGLSLTPLESLDDYLAAVALTTSPEPEHQNQELELIDGDAPVDIDGFCHVCNGPATFHIDFDYAYREHGRLVPNWRETLACSGCGLNNRMRAAIHLFEQQTSPRPEAKIYLTEQATGFFSKMSKRYPNTKGSEFLGDEIPPGSVSSQGIRNEDVTKLTFDDDSFDHILSFDVLEHVPDYRTALSEFLRTLHPGGKLLLSVPFRTDSAETMVRATIDADGHITHLLPPEFHGDPLRSEGCLSFYHFGWQFLDTLRDVGFINVKALLYWSMDYGYLGKDQILFVASKG